MKRGPRKVSEPDPMLPLDESKDNTLVRSASRSTNVVQCQPNFQVNIQLTSPMASTKPSSKIFCDDLRNFVTKCFSQFAKEDLFLKGHQGIAKVLDQYFETLTSMIKQDIITAATPRQQQQAFSFYCDCLRKSLKHHDYFNGYAMYLTLNHYEIEKLRAKTYSSNLKGNIESRSGKGPLVIPKACKKGFKSALEIYQESGTKYKGLLKSLQGKAFTHWIVPLYKKADKIKQMDTSTAELEALKEKAKINLVLEVTGCARQNFIFDPRIHRSAFIKVNGAIDLEPADLSSIDLLVESLEQLGTSNKEHDSLSSSNSSDWDESDSEIVLFEPCAPLILSAPKSKKEDGSHEEKLKVNDARSHHKSGK